MIFHNTLPCSSFSGEESLADVPHPKRAKGDEISQSGHKRSFNEKWRIKYLIDYNCLAECGGTYAEFMICMLCEQQFKCIKLDTIKKHVSRRHANLDSYTDGRKRAIERKYTRDRLQRQESLQRLTRPSKSLPLAPYKLALIIGQNKMPLSHSLAFVEFASAADTSSDVFKAMPSMLATQRGVAKKLKIHITLNSLCNIV